MSGWKTGDRAFRRVLGTVALVGGALALLGLVLRGANAALSLLLGAAIAVSNLYVLARIVGVLAVPQATAPSHAATAWGVLALGKLMVITAVMWVLLKHHVVDPIPFVLGYGSLPIGIAIGGVVSDKTDPESPERPGSA